MDNRVIDFAVENGRTNVLAYSMGEEGIFERVMGELGYKRKTTFFADLSIAEWYGMPSVKDTYNRVVKEWKGDATYFTEFVMSLNHKSWEWAERGYDELGALYSDLYYKADAVAMKSLKGKDLDYYIQTTD